MTELVNQPSAMPTRKLTVAALIGPAVTETWQMLMLDLYPALSGDKLSMLVGMGAAFLFGYYTRDKPNVALPDAG